VVDDRSGKGEGAASALGRVRVYDALDKCVEPVNWVSTIVVVTLVVTDLGSRNLKGISGVVVLEGGKQRSDLADEFLLSDAYSFCLYLLFNLVQGLALLIASGTLSIVNLLACVIEIGLQIFHFRLEGFDGIVELIKFVIF